jgi:hypothetical protein
VKEEVAGLFDVPRLRSTISNAVWVDDGSTYFTLDLKDQLLFNRFRHQVIQSIGGTEVAQIWENHMLQVCFTVSTSRKEVPSALEMHPARVLHHSHVLSSVRS